jgi:uncharacterized protein (TIGR00255 family)
MIKSMTGFGSAEGDVGSSRVTVEIRSVNHRFFNPSIKLPSELSKWEAEVREAMRNGISRGHATLIARVEHRDAEGGRLAQYLAERLALIEQAVNRIGERAPLRLIEQRDRLRTNIRELAQGVAVDEQRLAQEVAIMADRLDVSEEISRFHSHFVAFRLTLGSAAADGVGKRLGFLLQELLREANTTGSKANDAAILHEVIVIKEELERIREQVENLE